MKHRSPPSIGPAAIGCLCLLSTLLGCATTAQNGDKANRPTLMPEIEAQLRSSQPRYEPPIAADANNSIKGLPAATTKSEQRFSVNMVNAAPGVVFGAITSDSRLSVLVDPAIKAPITVQLRDVTLREALETLREVYGFEYKVSGQKLIVQAAESQTRVYKLNYPVLSRSGRSEVKVMSGSIAQGGNSSGQSNVPGPSNLGGGGQNQSGGGGQESSRITTSQRSDIWGEVEASVKLMVSEKDGGQVIVSPQTGTMVVRAMPRELRSIEAYLNATRISIERQVMLEAKILEVRLSETSQTGVNWSGFRNGGNSRGSVGPLTPGSSLSVNGPITNGNIAANPGVSIESSGTLTGGLFGLAFQTSNFAAVLDFLETQGNVQVLSSPRIATLNNQKAVLKVGTDDFFVTNISTTTTSTGSTSATSPTITVQPFFSGIALDVTPQIDENGYIILHVHPAVSSVKERSKVLNLGSLGNFTLPLASSSINETDSIVRARDGQIVAIGGLMRQEHSDSRSGAPGTGGSFLQYVLGQVSHLSDKQELVILLKPTVINSNSEQDAFRNDALSRLLDWAAQPTTYKGPR